MQFLFDVLEFLGDFLTLPLALDQFKCLHNFS
jgi:hypothetical protein